MYSTNDIWSYSRSSFLWFCIYALIAAVFFPIVSTYMSTVDLNETTIKKYIQEQDKYDIMQDKLNVKKYEDPFMR